jgi:hypothetical protein
MDRAYSPAGRGKKYMQSFGQEISCEVATWKTENDIGK